MPQVKHREGAPQKTAAKKGRTFRSFLLMEQLAAREIGARIALARRERGMTQDELAELTSFSKRSLQDYEAGVTIPYKHLNELSRLLRRQTEWFLYGDDPASVKEDQVAAMRSELAELREKVQEGGQVTADALRDLEAEIRALSQRQRPEDPPAKRAAR